MSAREVEDLLAGRQPDDRADLAPLVEVAAVLHASREVEPPPPMSDDLLAEIGRGARRETPARPRHVRRHRPRHLATVPTRRLPAPLRRPVVSLGAAAALLIGLVVVSSVFRPGGVDSAVSDVGSAIGLDVFRGDSAAPETASTTTSTTTTTVPPTTTAPPQTTTTAPPAPSEAPSGEPVPGAGQDPSWWFSPEAWELFQQYWDDGDGRDWGDDDRDGHSGRGDRDGDREGDGDGSDGETRPGDGTENGDGGGGSSTSTSSPPGSTPTSGASSSPDSGWSEDSTP